MEGSLKVQLGATVTLDSVRSAQTSHLSMGKDTAAPFASGFALGSSAYPEVPVSGNVIGDGIGGDCGIRGPCSRPSERVAIGTGNGARHRPNWHPP